MAKRNVIVIGASSGGLSGLTRLFAGLSPQINAAIFVVWHIAPDAMGILPGILTSRTSLQISNAVDCEPILFNRAYIAPPDHHLLVEKGLVRITRGPKENRFRPAIDPLFRSVALAYGPRVTGIILSGALDDGTAGLLNIKQFGGTAIVQDPKECDFPSMPTSAIREVEIDHVLPVSKMAELLERIVEDEVPDEKDPVINELRMSTEREIDAAMMKEQSENIIYGPLTPYSCPECHGVLSALEEGAITRFRCHTGHAYSADTLLSTLSENIETSIWSAISGMEESILLMNSLGDHFSNINDPKNAGRYFRKAREMEERARNLKHVVQQNERLSKSIIESESDK